MKEEKDRLAAGTTEIPAIIQANKIKGEIQINYFRLLIVTLALNETLSKVKALSALLPICARCKKIRDDQGYWHQVEKYIHEHSEADFTHSICPECGEILYPQAFRKKKSKT